MKIKKANIYSEQIFEKVIDTRTNVCYYKKRTYIRLYKLSLDIGGYDI